MDNNVGPWDSLQPCPDGRRPHIDIHRACHRARMDRDYAGGENPEVYSIAHGGEDPKLFPLGAAREPYKDEQRRRTTHERDGVTRRAFPRGVPERCRRTISLGDLLHHQPRQ